MKSFKELAPNTRNLQSARHFIAARNQADDLEFLHGLYPELNKDKLLEVKERLDGYFDVVLQTFLEKYPGDNIDDRLNPS